MPGLTGRRACSRSSVGGSGVGKDTVMRAARPLLPEATFVRRVITRPREPNEDHEPVTMEAFEACERKGDFAVTWRAHGLAYAIPMTVRRKLDRGGLAVVNGSRRALPDIERAFPRIAVFEITAGAEERARRLAVRGREPHVEIEQRIAREAPVGARFEPARIVNETTPGEAGADLAAAILEAAGA